jgi:hypothetical protein
MRERSEGVEDWKGVKDKREDIRDVKCERNNFPLKFKGFFYTCYHVFII